MMPPGRGYTTAELGVNLVKAIGNINHANNEMGFGRQLRNLNA